VKHALNVRFVSAAFALFALPAPPPTWACGLHGDDASFQRGVIYAAYPESLHVVTKVWNAQLAGTLERDEAQRPDMAPEGRRQLEYLRTALLLRQLQGRLAAAPTLKPRPSIAVLLLGPMMWSRYIPQEAGVALNLHVEGPADNDLVVVTEAPVIRALAEKRLTIRKAVQLGVLRFYGAPAVSDSALKWLSNS
jgi:hypothetical protein